MKKSAYFSDVAFAFTASFLPAICYLRYRGIPLAAAFFISLLFALGISLLTRLFLRRRYDEKQLKTYERKQAEMLAMHLAMLSQREQSLFCLERAQTLLDEKQGELQRKDGRFFIKTETRVAYCHFSLSPLTADQLLPILTYPTQLDTLLLCSGLTAEAKSLSARFSLRAIAVEEVYLRLKDAEQLPAEYKSAAAFTKKKKRRIQLWFQKSNAKPFLTGGSLVLVSSLFSPFPFYYLVMGCALILTSALVRIFGK